MADNNNTNEDLKKLEVTAADLNRVVPKLASRVLIGRVGGDTVLTFVMEMGSNKAQVIETLAIDGVLRDRLVELLQEEKSKEGAE